MLLQKLIILVEKELYGQFDVFITDKVGFRSLTLAEAKFHDALDIIHLLLGQLNHGLAGLACPLGASISQKELLEDGRVLLD